MKPNKSMMLVSAFVLGGGLLVGASPAMAQKIELICGGVVVHGNSCGGGHVTITHEGGVEVIRVSSAATKGPAHTMRAKRPHGSGPVYLPKPGPMNPTPRPWNGGYR